MSRSTMYSSHSEGWGSRLGTAGMWSEASRHSSSCSHASTGSPLAYLCKYKCDVRAWNGLVGDLRLEDRIWGPGKGRPPHQLHRVMWSPLPAQQIILVTIAQSPCRYREGPNIPQTLISSSSFRPMPSAHAQHHSADRVLGTKFTKTPAAAAAPYGCLQLHLPKDMGGSLRSTPMFSL